NVVRAVHLDGRGILRRHSLAALARTFHRDARVACVCPMSGIIAHPSSELHLDVLAREMKMR
ncbi:MAG TPA: hypothetical protein VD867_13510, partial [Burkholderiales bacterium]|nr:hypothetical protein [Burkholderiales bacterium]